MKNRTQIINTWRPFGPHPITHKPLTSYDYQSLDIDKDIHRLEFRGNTFHSTVGT